MTDRNKKGQFVKGHITSKEIKRKISISLKETYIKNPNLGFQKGHIQSEESRNKMSMTTKEKNQKIMLYLLNKLSKNSIGKKKLMKLMFLLEHYDFDSNRLFKTCSIGNSFNVYYYGVFSRKIQTCFDELLSRGEVEGVYLLIKTKKEVNLDDIEQDVKEKINKVISKFGDKAGYVLEVETLQMMGIKPCDKEEFFGRNVSELIDR